MLTSRLRGFLIRVKNRSARKKKMEKQSVISPILIWVMKNSKRKETDGHVAIEKFMIIDQNI